jgi:hypothetical protein
MMSFERQDSPLRGPITPPIRSGLADKVLGPGRKHAAIVVTHSGRTQEVDGLGHTRDEFGHLVVIIKTNSWDEDTKMRRRTLTANRYHHEILPSRPFGSAAWLGMIA